VTKYFLGYPEEKVGEKYTTKNQKYYGDFTQYYTNGNIHSFTTYSN
jgi:antitoxin component YwqK of YwqJK toxin-antitoxin module